MNSFKMRAFSLVEAMIILVLISVAIMAMVPLISQKSASSGIQLFQKAGNESFLGFGNLPKQKLGIGLNPKDLRIPEQIALNYTYDYMEEYKLQCKKEKQPFHFFNHNINEQYSFGIYQNYFGQSFWVY